MPRPLERLTAAVRAAPRCPRHHRADALQHLLAARIAQLAKAKSKRIDARRGGEFVEEALHRETLPILPGARRFDGRNGVFQPLTQRAYSQSRRAGRHSATSGPR